MLTKTATPPAEWGPPLHLINLPQMRQSQELTVSHQWPQSLGASEQWFKAESRVSIWQQLWEQGGNYDCHPDVWLAGWILLPCKYADGLETLTAEQ